MNAALIASSAARDVKHRPVPPVNGPGDGCRCG